MIRAGPLKVTRFSTRVIRGHAMVFRLWAGQFRNFLTGDSVADPDPGFGAFFTPGSGMGKKSRSEFGITRAYKQFFWFNILKFFDADPESGIFLTLDTGSGMENSDPGSGIREHPGSATLTGEMD
jgi:hypothetical protein